MIYISLKLILIWKKKGRNNATLKYLKSISPKPMSINLDNDKLYKKEFKNV